MANLVYPGGSGITTVVNTDLEADDMTFVGSSIAGAAQQTDYSDIKAGIVGNPGQLGDESSPVDGIYVQGFSNLSWNAATGGGLYYGVANQTSGALTGATDTIDVNLSSGAVVLACQLIVTTAITDSAGDDTWSAAYSGGSTQTICTGAAAAKNTKIDKMFDPFAATPILSGTTQITLTPNGGNFTAGEIRAVVYYIEFYESLTDV